MFAVESLSLVCTKVSLTSPCDKCIQLCEYGCCGDLVLEDADWLTVADDVTYDAGYL